MSAGGEPYQDEAPRAAKRTKHETGVKSRTPGEYRNGDISRVKSCDFDVFLSEENSLYTKNEIRSRELRGEYVPSDKADAKQIKAAAKEYCCRGLILPGYESRSPFVKVGENIASIPPPDKVPSHFDVKVGGVVLPVQRIVFFLYNGDLFIVKIASGPTHSQAVTRFISQSNDYQDAREDIFAFASSDGTYEMPGKNTAAFGGNKLGSGFAPDFGIVSLYPTRGGIPLLRGVFIAEVEVFHRDEGALIVRLSKYATIPQNKYLCGIKIYKDNDHKVHCAAIGVVWKRDGAKYEAIKIMNFGHRPARTSDIDKWIGIESTALGRLPSRNHSARTPSKWRHHPAVTYAGLPAIKSKTNGAVTLSITDADLVGGVKDSAGQPVDPDPNHSFDIDFGKILSASDGVVG